MSEIQEAIQSFPIVAWLSKHTKVYDTGGSVVYADCPICKAKKKLGVYRYNRVSVCGRCKDGGHGLGAWTGTASLPRMVKLLEGCEWRQAFSLIHELAGVPEPIRTYTSDGPEQIPEDAYPLQDCVLGQRGIDMLERRGVGHLAEHARMTVSGKYKARVILPCRFLRDYVGFEAKGTYPSHDPKSIYGSNMETDRVIYTAVDYDTKRTAVAITESVIDAETFHGLRMNAVGCFGGFKVQQVNALMELGVDTLYWFLDGDAYHKIPQHLATTSAFFDNIIVNMPDDADPNALGKDGVLELLKTSYPVANELDFMETRFKWGHSL